MQCTETLAEMLNVEPHLPTLFVRLNPSALPDDTLAALGAIAKPIGRSSDCLRLQLANWVSTEQARRLTGDDTHESGAWLLNWHALNDDELKCALVASFSWLQMGLDQELMAALTEIHRAVVTAAATRLGELHDAIQASFELEAKR